MFCEKCGQYCDDNPEMLCDSCWKEEKTLTGLPIKENNYA